MTKELKKSTKFADAHTLDKKIPRDLLMKYQGKWYILKAGLEWKANLLFKGGTWGVTTEIIERKPDYVLAKAVFKTKDGIEFSNYGEASKANVTNPQMHRYMLHLAVTRAECRVLRMATACGYTSVEEMDLTNKQIPTSEHDDEPASTMQLEMIKKLGGDTKGQKITKGQAKEIINDLMKHEKH